MKQRISLREHKYWRTNTGEGWFITKRYWTKADILINAVSKV